MTAQTVKQDAFFIASDILGEFVSRIDAGSAVSVAELCSPDVILRAMGLEGDISFLTMQMEQRDAAGYQSRHTVNSTRISSASDDEIRGTATIVSFRKGETGMASIAVADWVFLLRKLEDQWLFGEIGLDLFAALETDK